MSESKQDSSRPPDDAEAPDDETPEAEGAQSPEGTTVEPDALFRLQMAVSDFVIGNAKYLGYAVVAGLGGILVYGALDNWQDHRAEADFGAIGAIEFKMPKPAEMSEYGIVPADDPTDTNRLANVAKGAELFEENARAASGTAAVYGWLHAAEAWKRAGKADRALTAYEGAWKVGAGSLPGFTAASAYAAALRDAGRTDDAVAVLKQASSEKEAFYAEEALIQLARTYVDAGRPAEAAAVGEEFRTRFPDSPRIAQIIALGLVGAPPAPASGEAIPAPAGG